MSDTPKTAARKVTEENFSKLKEKLRELFQLDRGDLDFGLYRIMAHKSAEVDEFLKNDLLPQVAQALGNIAAADSETAQKELDEAILKAKEVGGVDPEQTDVVKNARVKLAAAKTDQQTEADTYNHLYNFFSRYYDEGDFMSLRRYKGAGKEAYSIPYNGEEVKLHWANADQYYIKTTENYCSYIFIPGDDKLRVRFETVKADNEKDNIKEANGKQRFFVLSQDFIAEEKNQLIVRFEHRPLTKGEKTAHPQNGIRRQASINKDAGKRILGKLEKTKGVWHHLLSALFPTEADPERTLLDKHIAVYTAKNSFDYFIHKDLGGFLRRELDAYIKSEVISVDNLELTDDPTVFIRGLAQVKAIRTVGHKIIDFLAQLENFQKQLWLKKKFVLETQYCVTLDKVPAALYPAIAKNRAQHDEWKALYSLPLPPGEGRGEGKPLTPEFLKENPYLVLDTRHFDQKFTDELLAGLSEAGPIDEQMNGLLVHGENSQGLRLLQERHGGQVKCVYIDPPYNTGRDEFIYKDNYRYSSWLTMLQESLLGGQAIMSEDGVLFHTVGDLDSQEAGSVYIPMFLNQIFPVRFGTLIWKKRGGAGHFSEQNMTETHDYIHVMGNSQAFIYKNIMPARKIALYKDKDSKGLFRWMEFMGGSQRTKDTNPALDFGFVVDTGKSVIDGLVSRDGKNKVEINPSENSRAITVYPPGDSTWMASLEKAESYVRSGALKPFCEKGKWTVKVKKHLYGESGKIQGGLLKSILSDVGENVGMNIESTKTMNDLFGNRWDDSIKPKPVSLVRLCASVTTDKNDWVADFFAGSGTTGHAVINLNREDSGQRKFILAEIGKHFDDVLLPRMKKVVYSTKWKDGKPEDRIGISQLLKYVRLESYEDTLDSLAVKSRKDLFTQEESKGIAEDYQLRYALGEETADSASLVGQDFIDPFNYTLSVVRDGVRHDVKADLAETFNFLLGLRLTSRRQLDAVLTITGTTRKGENCLILWRNLNKIDASQLDKWFTKHRQTFGNNLNLIYVNGDHTLNALRGPNDKWEAITTETVFRQLMFNGAE